MINARHVTYEQAFGVCVCVWVCVCGGGGGGGMEESGNGRKGLQLLFAGYPVPRKKGRRGGIITDVCSVERDGRLSFLGT